MLHWLIVNLSGQAYTYLLFASHIRAASAKRLSSLTASSYTAASLWLYLNVQIAAARFDILGNSSHVGTEIQPTAGGIWVPTYFAGVNS
jgi:hypothetical protein